MKLSISPSNTGLHCRCGKGVAVYTVIIRNDEGEDEEHFCDACLLSGDEHIFFPRPHLLRNTNKRAKPKRIRKIAQRQDAAVMGGLDQGRVQPASGSLPGYKSDGRVLGSHRIETKFTFAESFRLKLSDLSKIKGECWGPERPVMVIDFKEKQTGKLRSRWACIPHPDWEKYANASTADDQRPQDDP